MRLDVYNYWNDNELRDVVIYEFRKGYGVHSLSRKFPFSATFLHNRFIELGIKPNKYSRSLSKNMINVNNSEILLKGGVI